MINILKSYRLMLKGD